MLLTELLDWLVDWLVGLLAAFTAPAFVDFFSASSTVLSKVFLSHLNIHNAWHTFDRRNRGGRYQYANFGNTHDGTELSAILMISHDEMLLRGAFMPCKMLNARAHVYEPFAVACIIRPVSGRLCGPVGWFELPRSSKIHVGVIMFGDSNNCPFLFLIITGTAVVANLGAAWRFGSSR